MRRILPLLLSLILLVSCYYPQQEQGRPYGSNYNFVMVGDSLDLQVEQPLHNQPVSLLGDSVAVYKNDQLVVGRIMVIPEDTIDSIWVMVARDQLTMGWVHESELLSQVVPDDPISQFIYLFSQRHLIFFLALLLTVLVVYSISLVFRKRMHIVHFMDIATCYPTFLCITLSGSVVLYASIQRFIPETWVTFYYQPSLNPFGLPPILSLFVCSIWLLVILLIATIEEVIHQLPLSEAVLYMLSLVGVCMVDYLVLSLTVPHSIGYVIFIVYAIWAFAHYARHYRPHFLCGHCGAKMHSLGTCTHCGAKNAASQTPLKAQKTQKVY